MLSGPIIGGQLFRPGTAVVVASPTDGSRIGSVHVTVLEHVDMAIAAARAAQGEWDAAGRPARARTLRAMGDALEAETNALVALLALEAGKTLNDGVAEVREAVDFCRYYAALAEKQFAGRRWLRVMAWSPSQPSRRR